MIIEQWEQDLIGKPVEASMNFEDWFKGTLTEVIDLFAPYRVKREDGQTVLFIFIREA